MKKLVFLSLIFFLIISCKKEETNVITEALPPPVTNFTASFNYDYSPIDLYWSYSYASQISYYLLYSHPQGETDTLNPYVQSYHIPYAIKDTNYLFNIRVVDLDGNFSEAEVIQLSTYDPDH